MSISLVGVTNAPGSTGNVTSFSTSVPAGVADGDLLLWTLVGKTTTSTPTAATPSGWNVWDADNTTTNLNQSTYYRIASSEPGSYTATGLFSARWGGAMVALRGASTSTPMDVAIPAHTTGTSSLTYPAITPVTAGSWVIAIGTVIGPSVTTDISWTAGNLNAVDTDAGTDGTGANGFVSQGHKVWTSGAFTPTGPVTAETTSRTIGTTSAVRTGTQPISVSVPPVIVGKTIPTPAIAIVAAATSPATTVGITLPVPARSAAVNIAAPVIAVPIAIPSPGVEATDYPAIILPVTLPVPSVATNVGVTGRVTVPVTLPVPAVQLILNVNAPPIVVPSITIPAPTIATAVNAAVPATEIPLLIPLPLSSAGEIGSWVQPRGDVNRRASIPHATATSQEWGLATAYQFYQGRILPVGLHGDQITTDWTVTSTWSTNERDEAEVLLRLLRDVAREADARIDVHIAAPHGGSAIDFTGETHEIPQSMAPGSTTIEVTFTQVSV